MPSRLLIFTSFFTNLLRCIHIFMLLKLAVLLIIRYNIVYTNFII